MHQDSFNEEEMLDDFTIHQVCLHLVSVICDHEISILTGLPVQIIQCIRNKRIGSHISDEYDYPLIFTPQLMINRIYEMYVGDGWPVEIIHAETGVDYYEIARIVENIDNKESRRN